MCVGISSIKFALNSQFDYAVIAITIASIIDTIDGKIARLIKGTSKFGAELDSLIDFINFGVAPAITVTYALISGTLPSGISIDIHGLLSGTPTIVTSNVTSTFTVRVTDNLGNLRDRTFSMTIVGSNPPKILKFDPLGTYFDGQYVDIDITALDLDIEDTITWSLSAGQLPDGVTLDKHTGKISGFIRIFLKRC